MTSVVIVEDLPPIARSLARKVAAWRPSSQISVFSDLESAREFLAEAKVDLLLLDLNLSGQDGFDLLREWTCHSFQTIVVSGHTDRALEAFELEVLDFVPKPVDPERLFKALNRLSGDTDVERPAIRFFSVRSHGQIRFIEANKVDYIQGAGKYAELVLKDKTVVLHNKSLEQLSALLAPHYVRVHKSYLVALDQIQRLDVLGGGRYRALLRSGSTTPVGRSRYRFLCDRLV